MLYIIIAILMFGVLIAVHEWGHFVVAKLTGVQVNEFAIGMGPKLFSKKKGDTLYSLRAIPMGGYCAMEGEEEETDSPGSFFGKPLWKRFLILVAGSLMNYVTGFVILVFLFAQSGQIVVPVISNFMDGFAYESEEGLLPGDRILAVNGHKIYVYADIGTYFAAAKGETMDLLIERDGQRLERKQFPLALKDYVLDGETQKKYGLYFELADTTPGLVLQESWNTSWYFARSVWSGLQMLVQGGAKLNDFAGPVGIVSIIGQTGEQAASPTAAVQNIFYLIALIAVNLAIVNLLPIPALDGGRIFFMLLSEGFYFVTRRRINPKYENYLHMLGFAALLLLMLVVTFNDVIRLVH